MGVLVRELFICKLLYARMINFIKRTNEMEKQLTEISREVVGYVVAGIFLACLFFANVSW